MASIIKMNSTEFFDFVDRYDYREFNFLLISKDITTTGKYNNVFKLDSLIPAPNIVSEFITNGYSKKYKKKYLKYLSNEKVDLIIATIVKLAVVENTDVVLLCSDNETQYNYLDLISEYLEKEYCCKACSYKKFRKNRKETNHSKNKQKIIDCLNDHLKEHGAPDTMIVDKKEFKKNLKELSRSELIKYCDDTHIKYKEKWDKKRIIESIMNTVFK